MILQEIVAHKRQEIAERVQRVPAAEIERRAGETAPARQFEPGPDIALIAEVKRRSPSAGQIAASLDPVQQATAYEAGGASAISVLTDARYFGGSFEDLERVKAAVSIPVLCKDFILTPYQVYEARSHGADLLLLIVGALDDEELGALRELALSLGMTPLVEVHDQHELARAIACGATLIGINNRNLNDFTVDLLTTEYLAPLVPDDAVLVSESGIATREDVERVVRAGARVVLVGEALMRSPDPAERVRELVG